MIKGRQILELERYFYCLGRNAELGNLLSPPVDAETVALWTVNLKPISDRHAFQLLQRYAIVETSYWDLIEAYERYLQGKSHEPLLYLFYENVETLKIYNEPEHDHFICDQHNDKNPQVLRLLSFYKAQDYIYKKYAFSRLYIYWFNEQSYLKWLEKTHQQHRPELLLKWAVYDRKHRIEENKKYLSEERTFQYLNHINMHPTLHRSAG